MMRAIPAGMKEDEVNLEGTSQHTKFCLCCIPFKQYREPSSDSTLFVFLFQMIITLEQSLDIYFDEGDALKM